MVPLTNENGFAAVDLIDKSDYGLQTKIIRLWSISMLFYRHPVGDAANAVLHRILGVEQTAALAFLTGAASCRSGSWLNLVPELQPKDPNAIQAQPA